MAVKGCQSDLQSFMPNKAREVRENQIQKY